MTLIKYAIVAILALLLVPLIVLVFLGGLRGHAHHVVSVDIARAPATVFAAVKSSIGSAPILRLQPDAAIEYRIGAADEYTGTARYDFDDMGARGTRLTYRETRQYERLRDKLWEPVISRAVQQRLEADVAQLKTQIESR
jgi:hypothetical protein